MKLVNLLKSLIKIVILFFRRFKMPMSFGGVSKKVVATKIVAVDGTGDFTDIQTAVNALPAGGGVVYVKEGTYTITTAISITSDNVSIIGAGKSTKIQTTADISLIHADTVLGIFIEKVWIHGSGAGNLNNKGIYFENVSNSSVTDCWFDNIGTYGIHCEGGNTNYFSGNDMTTCLVVGIYAKTSDYNLIDSNRIYSCKIGVNLDHSDYDIVQNNVIYSNVWDGILSYYADYNIYTGNQVYANEDRGIAITSSRHCVVSGNLIKDNDVNNTATHDGIYISMSSYNNITGNRCYNNDRYEINVWEDSSNRNVVVGNNCYGTDHVGMINDNGTGTIIEANYPPAGTHYWSCSGHNFKGIDHGATPELYFYEFDGQS
ncbi:unnamed protein product, partial [marine sediment metagenome]